MGGWNHEDYEMAPTDLIGEIIELINKEQQEREQAESGDA